MLTDFYDIKELEDIKEKEIENLESIVLLDKLLEDCEESSFNKFRTVINRIIDNRRIYYKTYCMCVQKSVTGEFIVYEYAQNIDECDTNDIRQYMNSNYKELFKVDLWYFIKTIEEIFKTERKISKAIYFIIDNDNIYVDLTFYYYTLWLEDVTNLTKIIATNDYKWLGILYKMTLTDKIISTLNFKLARETYIKRSKIKTINIEVYDLDKCFAVLFLMECRVKTINVDMKKAQVVSILSSGDNTIEEINIDLRGKEDLGYNFPIRVNLIIREINADVNIIIDEKLGKLYSQDTNISNLVNFGTDIPSGKIEVVIK